MYKIGLLGASWIAPQAIIDPASILPNAEISAVAARNMSRAQSYAKTHGIPRVLSDYDALLADPDLDIIYISLPPVAHAEWSIKALQAGKHVICEKPTAMNLAEAQAMVAAAKASGKRLVEAFHSRYHPAFETCMDWVRSGKIGTVTNMTARFGVGIPDDGVKNQYRPELGGGSGMDMGCYPLNWVREMAGVPIKTLEASAVVASSGVDESMQATLAFEDGSTASISCSMHPDTPFGADMIVTGTAGTIKFHNPLVPHRDGVLTCTVGDTTENAAVSTVPTYCYQLAAILQAIETGAELPTDGEGLLDQQAAIDLLYAQAKLSHLRQ